MVKFGIHSAFTRRLAAIAAALLAVLAASPALALDLNGFRAEQQLCRRSPTARHWPVARGA